MTLSTLLLLNLVLFAQEIKIDAPQEVTAGNSFFVTINLSENCLNGIARYSLSLPNGFQAEARSTANADFKFEDQKAVFQWLNFPQNKSVELSLQVSTTVSAQGTFALKSFASYLQEDEPKRLVGAPHILTVQASDQAAGQELNLHELKNNGISCIRQVPYYNEEGQIQVNLLINKGNFKEYGKIQEKIPVGFRVVNLMSQNAIFIYNEKLRTVKYMWMTLPTKEQFMVSYVLIPDEDYREDTPFLIYGSFQYAENKETRQVDIQERGIEISPHDLRFN